jgi:hypothetical protein
MTAGRRLPRPRTGGPPTTAATSSRPRPRRRRGVLLRVRYGEADDDDGAQHPSQGAQGEELARTSRIPARCAANLPLGFWSEWRKADPQADHRPQHADALDRIAAFTDEMTEMLTSDRSSPHSPPKPDNASGDTAQPRHADSVTLFADCQKVLRAAVGIAA